MAGLKLERKQEVRMFHGALREQPVVAGMVALLNFAVPYQIEIDLIQVGVGNLQKIGGPGPADRKLQPDLIAGVTEIERFSVQRLPSGGPQGLMRAALVVWC